MYHFWWEMFWDLIKNFVINLKTDTLSVKCEEWLCFCFGIEVSWSAQTTLCVVPLEKVTLSEGIVYCCILSIAHVDITPLFSPLNIKVIIKQTGFFQVCTWIAALEVLELLIVETLGRKCPVAHYVYMFASMYIFFSTHCGFRPDSEVKKCD